MFEKMNINPVAQAILLHLSRSPGKEFYLREIVRMVGGSLGGCHNSLKELEALGLVKSRTSGRNLYFSADDTEPAIAHFKIFANLVELNELLAVLRPMAAKVVLFGSCSVGKDTAGSDVDLAVVADEPVKARNSIKSVPLSRPVRAVVFTPAQYLRSRDDDPAFHGEIDKGIVLYRADERV